ncbi:MAG: GNAT family N-acetyltransferase [Flavitalea sp.]
MLLRSYGIILERLSQKHLEMVLQWRNNEFVRSRMQFREIISKELHQQWFTNLHPQHDWYFVAYADELPYGVFHIKNIRPDTNSGEAGAFVGNQQFIGDANTAFAILALMDFGFLLLKLDALEAAYNPAFEEIQLLNQQLGYEPYQQEKNGFVRARVYRQGYFQAASGLRNAATKLRGNIHSISTSDPWITSLIQGSGHYISAL